MLFRESILHLSVIVETRPNKRPSTSRLWRYQPSL